MSQIEWTNHTWNCWWGCGKIAPECLKCYAARLAGRGLHPHMVETAAAGDWTGLIVPATESVWNAPFTWKKPSLIFTCSMSDFWHQDVPLPLLDRALDVMDRTPQHIYQILSKRPGNAGRKLAALGRRLPKNVWVGVTIGHTDSLPSLKPFLKIEAPIHFLSDEPLLTSLAGMPLDGIDWVIVGGESGPTPRRTNADWMRDLRDRSVARGTPFFLKQWGNWESNPTPRHLELDPPRLEGKKKVGSKGGATLDGRLWREFPALAA
jgi:protein gp37